MDCFCHFIRRKRPIGQHPMGKAIALPENMEMIPKRKRLQHWFIIFHNHQRLLLQSKRGGFGLFLSVLRVAKLTGSALTATSEMCMYTLLMSLATCWGPNWSRRLSKMLVYCHSKIVTTHNTLPLGYSV